MIAIAYRDIIIRYDDGVRFIRLYGDPELFLHLVNGLANVRVIATRHEPR